MRSQQEVETTPPQPRGKRGNRRATGGSAFTGAEPKLAGLTRPSASEDTPDHSRDAWLKEQRPPHYGGS